MRMIEAHKVNGCNELIEVQVIDQPGSGGANHKYRICVPMIDPVERHAEENCRRSKTYCDINFQDGPIAEAGVNGITHEAIIAVLIDRLEAFQGGPFACQENQVALDSLLQAQEALHARTKKRLARGVEGTHTV